MKHLFWIVPLVAALLGAAYYLERLPRSQNAIEAAPLPSAASAARSRDHELGIDSESVKAFPPPGISEDASYESDIQLPNSEEMREEVTANPHGTPSSAIEFAHELATKMMEAEGSESQSVKLFGQLEQCAQSTQNNAGIPESVVAICVSNMARLAESYPTRLAARHKKAISELSPRVMSIVETLGY